MYQRLGGLGLFSVERETCIRIIRIPFRSYMCSSQVFSTNCYFGVNVLDTHPNVASQCIVWVSDQRGGLLVCSLRLKDNKRANPCVAFRLANVWRLVSCSRLCDQSVKQSAESVRAPST